MPRRPVREVLLSLGAIAACLAFCNQAATAAGSTSSQAKSFPFQAVAEDAQVVKGLVALENLIVADGARAIREGRPLARRLERRNRLMERLCAGIIRDAAIGARTQQRARRAHSSTVLDATSLTRDIEARIQALIRNENISIVEMFEMQMLMNHLSQLSEMSGAVISASNAAIASLARNLKS